MVTSEFCSLNYNHSSLEIRADEGRVKAEDLKLAGIDKIIADTMESEHHKYDSDDSDSMLSQPASNTHSYDFDDDEFPDDDDFTIDHHSNGNASFAVKN